MENNEEFLRNRIKQGGLVSGRVCEDQFRLLVDMSSIRSEKMVQALQEYLVQGKSRIAICEHTGWEAVISAYRWTGFSA